MGAAHLTELAEDEGTLKSFGDALGSKGPRPIAPRAFLRINENHSKSHENHLISLKIY